MLVLICFMVSFASVAQASQGDRLLKVGSRGQEVVELQTKLNGLGFSVGNVDGIFGYRTKQGVVNFQKANYLAADGIVGPLTSGALNKYYPQSKPQSKVNNILSMAKTYIGVPYQWGGSSPKTGFDCSGFVSYVYGQNGITLPRVSRDQYKVGTWVSFENLKPGDLMFFSFKGNGVVDHVGIYMGNGQFINASSSKGVTIYPIGPYWKSVYVGAKRVI